VEGENIDGSCYDSKVGLSDCVITYGATTSACWSARGARSVSCEEPFGMVEKYDACTYINYFMLNQIPCVNAQCTLICRISRLIRSVFA
jgi:hypothetical protein